MKRHLYVMLIVALFLLPCALAVGPRPVIRVTFNEPIWTGSNPIEMKLNNTLNQDYTSKLVTTRVNSTSFRFDIAPNDYLPSGQYRFTIKGRDIRGVWGDELSTTFTVVITGIDFTLLVPNPIDETHGVFAGNQDFTVRFETSIPAQCKFSTDGETIPDEEWEEMEYYMSYGSSYITVHEKRFFTPPFNPDPAAVNKVKIQCEDVIDHNHEHTITYIFSIDMQPPQIVDFRAVPSLVTESPSTTLIIDTNEPTKCKYLQSSTPPSYTSMLSFGQTQYQTTATKQITVPLQEGVYRYYGQCEDQAQQLTGQEYVEVTVALNAPLEILEVLSPDYYITGPQQGGQVPVLLNILTNKQALCSYNRTHGGVTTAYTSFDTGYATDHEATAMIPAGQEGSHTFHFRCTKNDEKAHADHAVMMILSGPTMLIVNDSTNLPDIDDDRTYLTDRLPLSMRARDDQSNIVKFNVSLYKSGTSVPVLSRTYTPDGCQTVGDHIECWKNTFDVTGLDLDDQTWYLFEVWAENQAGQRSAAMQSDGVLVDVTSGFIHLVRPINGVFTDTNYTVRIETLQTSVCKFSNRPVIPGPKDWATMRYFESDKGDASHLIHETYLNGSDAFIQGVTNKLFIKCNDGAHMPNASYDLTYDTVPPVINSFVAIPSLIVEDEGQMVYFDLNISTNENTYCRYSEVEGDEYEDRLPFDGPEVPANFKKKFQVEVSRIAVSGTFDYYAECVDLGGLETGVAHTQVTVDLTVPLTIDTSLTPTYYSQTTGGNVQVPLKIFTNKLALCFWGYEGNATPVNLFQDSQQHYVFQKTVTIPVPSDGDYTFPFRCVREEEDVRAEKTIYVDSSAPDITKFNDSSSYPGVDPQYTFDDDKLPIWVIAEDNGTRVTKLNLEIYEDGVSSDTRIYNQNKTISSGDCDEDDGNYICEYKEFITNLDLADQKRYFFKGKAYNLAGLVSGVETSDGITVDIDLEPDYCRDLVKNGNESDVDCGGRTCSSCEINKTCRAHPDCRSAFCNPVLHKCKEATCNDGFLNGDETDVDCGGDDCDACGEGDDCIDDGDCESGICDPEEEECAEEDSCSNGRLDIGEADVDCGGVCPDLCGAGDDCDSDSDCQSGLECDNGECSIVEGPGCTSDADCAQGQQCDETTGHCMGSGCIRSGDCDGDGMPDAWEQTKGFDPTDPTDASRDSDSDGLPNKDEYTRQTDPKNPDTDGDGYLDGDEVANGWDPTDPDDPGSGLSWIWLVLLILLAVAIIGVGGYFTYQRYGPAGKKKFGMDIKFDTKRPGPGLLRPHPQVPFTPGTSGMSLDRRKHQYELRSKMRQSAMDAFGAGKTSSPSAGFTPKLGDTAVADGAPINEMTTLRTELSKYGDFSKFAPAELDKFKGMTRRQLQTILANKNAEQIKIIVQNLSTPKVKDEYVVDKGEKERKATNVRMAILPNEDKRKNIKGRTEDAVDRLAKMARRSGTHEEVFSKLAKMSKAKRRKK